MASSALGALESSLRQHLPAEVRELKARIRQLEEQQLSSCRNADGTRKTWQEVAMNLRRVVAEERDANEWLEGNIFRATEMLEAARAQAGPAAIEMFQATGRSETQQVLERVHNIVCDAIATLEDQWPMGPPSDFEDDYEAPSPTTH